MRSDRGSRWPGSAEAHEAQEGGKIVGNIVLGVAPELG